MLMNTKSGQVDKGKLATVLLLNVAKILCLISMLQKLN